MNSKTASFYVTGGTVPRDAPSYVQRQADTDLIEGLRQGQFCYVLTSRQMGKSSLMARTAARLRAEGVAVAVLDLTAVGQNLTPEQWYDGLLNLLARALDLEEEMEAFWFAHQHLGPLQRWMQGLNEVALRHLSGPIVLFIDEIDAVRSLPFSADEFFAAIRECYNRRVEEPAYQRLSFCLLGVASPSDLIRDTRNTPFNIGHRIELNDFTPAAAALLAAGLGVGHEAPQSDLGITDVGNHAQPQTHDAQRLLSRVLYWTGGHPYLTQRLCRAVSEALTIEPGTQGVEMVDRQCAELYLSSRARERDDNLIFVREHLLRSETDRAGLLDLYHKVLSGKAVPDDEAQPLVTVLKLSGVVSARQGWLRVRNRIYAVVFDRSWIIEHMPDAEVRRQQHAFRRGAIRTLAVSGSVLAVVVALAVYAFTQARRANDKANEANRLLAIADMRLYIDDMNLIPASYNKHKMGRVQELLEETSQNKFSGFEWGFWNRLCHLDLLILNGHSGPVSSVAFSPDGKFIITGSDDKTAKIWDVQTGRPIRTLKKHTKAINCVAFSPDGQLAVTGSDDNTAEIWDVPTGRPIRTLPGHGVPVWAVAFSPDGKEIVTGSGNADDQHIVTRSDDNTAKIWDTKTGHEIRTLTGHTGPIWSVAFSLDGKEIVTGSNDNTAKVWNAQTGHMIFILKGHDAGVVSVAFSPDSRRIVTGSEDKTAKVWNAETGRLIHTLPGHSAWVHSVAFSPDGTRIATASFDTTAKVWDARTYQEILTLQGHTGLIWSTAFSPDSKCLVTSSEDHTAKIWDALSDRKVRIIEGHTGPVWAVAFSHDSKCILVGSEDHTAKVWNVQNRHVVLTLHGHKEHIGCVAYSLDGHFIATGSDDNTARVWDARSGRAICILEGHTSPVWSVAFSPNDELIVTGSEDKSAKIWDTKTGRLIRTLEGHEDVVSSVAFSPDGKFIVTGSGDKTARIWETKTGRLICPLDGHAGSVWSVAFSPDGRFIVTGSEDHTAKVWNAPPRRETVTLKGHDAGVISVAFSHDSRRIVTGSEDHTAKVWDTETGHELLTLTGHIDCVHSVAFSPDDKKIVTGSLDGTVRVWSSDF